MNQIINREDFKKDKYLFNLVSHNLDYNDYQVITDNKNYAFVIGKPNKEIWIWTSSLEDNVINELINKLNEIISKKDYCFVSKKDLYERLKEKINYIEDNPFIYDNYVCEKIIEPLKVDGFLAKATLDDKDVIAHFWKDNCDNFGYDITYELCLKFAESWINSNTFYVWKNNNQIVSFVGYEIVDNTAEISHAYTSPKERGKGYMPYLIYSVTKIIMSKGLLPILNTDYSYDSSNNAYKKVGFKETELIYSFSTIKHKD